MKYAYKGNVKNRFRWAFSVLSILLTFFIYNAGANPLTGNRFFQVTPQLISANDTTIVPVRDTIDIKSDDDLKAPVIYHANDSLVMDVPAKRMYLYGTESKVDFEDNKLQAPLIMYDQGTDILSAYLVKDSAGKAIAFPTFDQADFSSRSDTIRFNLKTQKGLTKGTYTQQGEMFVYGEKIKKISPDVFYALKGTFTTCNLDTPHFAFVSKKVKLINKKMAFTGPVHPEFEGVPLPIVLPFGIYPLQMGRHSGLLAPAFSSNDQMGLSLEGLGYYKVFGDHWDAVVRGTLYSYGGWTLGFNPRYFKRYKYQGDLSLDVQHFKTNFKGDPDYTSSQTFNLRWTHMMDNKAHPGITFRASVNAGSSKFNQQVPNNPTLNFTNQMNSSISFARNWKNRPYNISINANHNQNTQNKLINLNLPDIAFNVNTLYPFRRENPIGKLKWYENLGIGLNTNARSLTSFYDTSGNMMQQIADNLQWGAMHSVPITLSLPELGHVQISPSVSYQERWYQKKTIRSWDAADRKLDTSISHGFYTAREMTFGLGASTRIFGMFGFKKSSRVQAIRHEIRPSIALNYKPDLNSRAYYETQIDTFGRMARYSVYEGSIYGTYGAGKFGGLSFSIDNNIGMKVRGRGDSSKVKKVSILDGLSLNGTYNFLADSFRLGPLNLNARSNILNKINITASAVMDPYLNDSLGRPVDRLVWTKTPFTLGRMRTASISLQSSFRGGENKKGKDNNVPPPPNLAGTGITLDEYQREAAYIYNNPGEFADFSIPWDISFSYSLRFQNNFRQDLRRFKSQIFQDVNWNGSMNLTPKWKLGVNGFYNITLREIGTISMFLSRDMHCWQMAVNISPVGRYRFFNITISPKSVLLRDLKINRTRYFFDF